MHTIGVLVVSEFAFTVESVLLQAAFPTAEVPRIMFQRHLKTLPQYVRLFSNTFSSEIDAPLMPIDFNDALTKTKKARC